MTQELFDILNKRRFYLINKKYNDGLIINEEKELKKLQRIAQRWVNRVAPLPETKAFIEILK